MRFLLGILGGLALMAAPAQGQVQMGYSGADGELLSQLCLSEETASIAVCTFYILGYMEGLHAGRLGVAYYALDNLVPLVPPPAIDAGADKINKLGSLTVFGVCDTLKDVPSGLLVEAVRASLRMGQYDPSEPARDIVLRSVSMSWPCD